MAIDLATHYLEEAGRQMRGHKRMGEGAMKPFLGKGTASQAAEELTIRIRRCLQA
jgi:hypothetical protein